MHNGTQMTQMFMIDTDNYKHSDITKKIIKAFYKVYNTLGYGFLEKVYENALFIELRAIGLFVEKQKQIKVYYEGKEVGEYFADLIVADCVIVELKAAESLCEEHGFQLINYLKATEIEVGLLLNFGKKPEFTRKVFSNEVIERR
jgi:GxxExxY protein